MGPSTSTGVSGKLHIKLTDSATGEVREIETHNKVVDFGLEYIAQAIAGGSTRRVAFMAIGQSNQPVAASDKWLMSEQAREAVNVKTSANTVTYTASFAEGEGTATICELALFINDTYLFARTVIPGANKTATTSMDVTWTITLNASS